MARTRVDELARVLGVESAKVLSILSTMGAETRDNTTILSDREARAVRDAITRQALIKQRETMRAREPQPAPGAATVQRAKPVQQAVQKAQVVRPAPQPVAPPAARRADGPAPAMEKVKARLAPAPTPATVAEALPTRAEPTAQVAATTPEPKAVRPVPAVEPAGESPPTKPPVAAKAAPAATQAPAQPRRAPERPAQEGQRPADRPAPRRPAPRPGAAPGRPASPAGRPKPTGAGAGTGSRGPAARPRPSTAGRGRPRTGGRRGRDARRGGELDARNVRRTTITLDGPVSVRDLAVQIGAPIGEAVKQLMGMGVMATVNQMLDLEVASKLAAELGAQVAAPDAAKEDAAGAGKDGPTADRASKFMRVRPPVITVMGHVDHGKTTLLDAIRKSDVAAHEAGGITQHIGASVVNWQDTKLVFIDTPGHEAFTAMRARGAQVTDVVVLVVAADDGVKPQTVEAIDHIRAAKVPMIVAVNKIDRPGADAERVKRQLTDHGVVAEDWGGDTVFVNVSALQGEGIDTLLEMILLVTEMQELKANPISPARGTVIEAKLDRGRGPVATILVQSGTIRVGDIVVSGTSMGRVRALFDEKGDRLDQAGPSQPVEVLGLDDVPTAGDLFAVVEDDRAARDMVAKAGEQRKGDQTTRNMLSLEELYNKIQAGAVRDLNLVVKVDVHGSLEALQASLAALTLEEVRVQVLHGGVGPINENDVMLAVASDAIIIGFNVKPDTNARRVAQREQVDIRTYQIIYEVLDDITAAAKGMLAPKMQKVQIGKAQVRATFGVPRVGIIAGCYVLDGRITRNAEARVMREGKMLHEGRVTSLKRFKDDAREVQAGFECGIGIDGFEAFVEGDIIEAYLTERVERAS